MAEALDYVKAWNFSEGAGASINDEVGVDDLAIQGTNPVGWVTTGMPGLDAVGYRFSRAGDGRAQTLVTGGDLFGASEEYTVAVRAILDPDDAVQSMLIAPSDGISDDDITGYLQPWSDRRVWAGHVVAGSYQEVAESKSVIEDSADEPHWWVVTATDNGDGTVRVRLYVDGVLVAIANRTANADSNAVDRVAIANLYDGSGNYGCDCTVFGVRIYDRALDDAEVPELGVAPGGSNTPPVANAGADESYNEGAVVSLDASGSMDAETAPENLLFTWTVVNAGGTGLVTGDLVNADQAAAQFVAPSVTTSTAIVLQVEVEDEGGLTDTDQVTITVDPVADPSDLFPNEALDAVVELLLGDTWVDITARVVSQPGAVKATITRGRQDWAQEVESAQCKLTLLNSDGRFSSRNPTGPYYGLLGRNVQLRVTVTRANVYHRFWGEAGSWPQSWEPTETLVTTDVTAHGIIHRLSQGADPIQSVLRREIPNRLENLVGYWPGEDAAGPNRRRLSSGLVEGNQMRIVSDARPEFANFNGFDASAPILTLNDADLRGDVEPYTFVAGEANLQFGFVVHVPSGGAAGTETLVWLQTSAAAENWQVWYETANGGQFRLVVRDGTEAQNTLLSQVTHQNVDGVPLLIVVQAARAKNETAIDWTFYAFLPGGDPEGRSYSGSIATTNGLGRAEKVQVNPGGGHSGTAFGHLFVQSAIQSPLVLVDALAAYAGETAGRRIERVCAENAIPFTSIGDLDDTEPMGPQRVGTLLETIREAATTDLGMLYESREQFGLGYRTRTSLYNQTPIAAFTYGNGQLSLPFQPVEDDAEVRNDVTVQAPDGATARRTLDEGPLSTQAPPDGIGRYTEQFEVNAEEGRLDSHAGWRLTLRTVDEARYPEISVELSNPQIVADTVQTHAVLSADVGDRLTIGNMPFFLPPDPVSQLIQGYTEQIYKYRHSITWNCSPESPYQVPLLGEDLARLDTDGSETSLDFEAGVDTALSVLTTRGFLWTTDAADMPFDIRTAGVVLEVTDVDDGFEDTFGRTVSNGWDIASGPAGGWTWVNEGGAASDYAVGSGVGTVEDDEAGGATRRVLIPADFVANNIGPDLEALWSVSIPQISVGNAAQASMIVREDGANTNMYVMRVIFGLAGNIQLRISIRDVDLNGGVETTLVDAPGSQADYVGGTVVHVRSRILGDEMLMRCWTDSDPEPTAWQIGVRDDTHQAAGRIGLRSSIDSGWTGATPLTFTWHRFVIVNPQVLTVTQAPINGIAKTVPAGSSLQLEPTPRLRL